MKKQLLVFMLATTSILAWAGEIEITKKEDAGSVISSSYYQAHTDACTMVWQVTRHPDQIGFSRIASRCELPMMQQQVYWDALLERILADNPSLQKATSFYWGSLEENAGDNSFSGRLMRAAAQSAEWDNHQGTLIKSPHSLSNRFVEKLLFEEHVFAELTPIMAKHHFQLKGIEIEKVRIRKSRIDGKDLIVPYSGEVTLLLAPRP